MKKTNCRHCRGKLSNSEIRYSKHSCRMCIGKFRIEKIQSHAFLEENFNKKWSSTLFKKYILYLIELNMSIDIISKYSGTALKIFQIAEKEIIMPFKISEEWLIEKQQTFNIKNIKPSLFIFLVKEGHFKINSDDNMLTSIDRLVNKVPREFKRLLEIYIGERIKLRNRQVKFNARSPLSLNTIKSDLETYTRLIHWFVKSYPHIDSWNSIQQEDVHEFLLTLTPKNREIVRKDLLVLFKLAKKKRLITHIPILDIKSRELPPTIEAISEGEQVRVATLIKLSLYEKPLEGLLTSLCFYHGLSSSHIRNIKIVDINIESKTIYFADRPPVYLLNDDLIMLKEYANRRLKIKNHQNKSYLFLSASSTEIYHDRPVNNPFIARKVKAFCGFTPKGLRITCLNMIASHFGSQLLVEGFGLSLTQASRYGRLEDYLIEEQIKEQRD